MIIKKLEAKNKSRDPQFYIVKNGRVYAKLFINTWDLLFRERYTPNFREQGTWIAKRIVAKRNYVFVEPLQKIPDRATSYRTFYIYVENTEIGKMFYELIREWAEFTTTVGNGILILTSTRPAEIFEKIAERNKKEWDEYYNTLKKELEQTEEYKKYIALKNKLLKLRYRHIAKPPNFPSKRKFIRYLKEKYGKLDTEWPLYEGLHCLTDEGKKIVQEFVKFKEIKTKVSAKEKEIEKELQHIKPKVTVIWWPEEPEKITVII